MVTVIQIEQIKILYAGELDIYKSQNECKCVIRIKIMITTMMMMMTTRLISLDLLILHLFISRLTSWWSVYRDALTRVGNVFRVSSSKPHHLEYVDSVWFQLI